MPYRLRYLSAWDHGLSRAVLAVHARALRDFYRQRRMQLIATIEDPAVIHRILAHLGLPGTREGPAPCSMTEVGGKQLPLPGVPV